LIGRWENGVIRTGNRAKLEIITQNLWRYISSRRTEIHPTFGKPKKRRINTSNTKRLKKIPKST
jgi:hypothetical protein